MNFLKIETQSFPCFNPSMSNKGFADTIVETPISDESTTEKPLKPSKLKSQRVDINVLKSKLQETEYKEFKKNLFILSFLVICLGALGIYLSL